MSEGRLVSLLEQYRRRLHSQGEQGHDEELDYIQQILESPFISEFMSGQTSSEDVSRFQEVTSEVFSVFDTPERDAQLSPQSKRKRQLARKASLRALKLAITPKNSPATSKRPVKDKRRSVGSPPLHAAMSALTVSGDHTLGNHTSGIPKEGSSLAPSGRSNLEHIYISPFTGKKESSITSPTNRDSPSPTTSSRLGSEDNQLSHSTSTLVEKSTPSSSSLFYHSELLRGDLVSMASSVDGPGPQQPAAVHGNLTHNPSLPHLSTSGHSQLHNGGYAKQITNSPGSVRAAAPPTYTEALNARRKARSFDKLLDTPTPGLGDLGPHHPPPPAGALPPYYLGGPATSGTPTQNATTGPSQGQLVTVRLQKGDQGLGFSITGHKSPKKGELGIFVQELQRGGVAEREGSLFKGDQLVSINGQSLVGIGHRTAVALLQQSQGTVELVVQRGIAGSGRPNPAPAPAPDLSYTLRSMTASTQVSPPRPSPPSSSPTHALPKNKVEPTTTTASFPPPTPPSHGSKQYLFPQSHPLPAVPTVPSPQFSAPSSSTAGGPLPQLVAINLANSGKGFGFSVIPGNGGRTLVHLISGGSVVEEDGRLMRGDQLVQVNGENVQGVPHSEVVDKLHTISRSGQPLEMIVARARSSVPSLHQQPQPLQRKHSVQKEPEIDRKEEEEVVVDGTENADNDEPDSSEDEDEEDTEASLSDLEEVAVEFNRPTGAGLGIKIAAYVNETEEDKGIYIAAVNPSGPAGLTGLIKEGDKILCVSGQPLRGLSNVDAAATLRTCGLTVKLVLGRKKVANMLLNDEDKAKQNSAEKFQPTPNNSDSNGRLGLPSWPKEEKERSTGQDKAAGHMYKERATGSLSPSVEVDLRQKWESLLGPSKVVKVDQITKPDDEGGLGFKMETTVVLDDTGQPQIGSVRHVIKYIRDDGPMGVNKVLQVGDEILEVNGIVLVNADHDEAINAVRNASKIVQIVACRDAKEGMDSQDGHTIETIKSSGTPEPTSQQTTTSDSEDDHCSSSAPPSLTPASSNAVRSMYFSSIHPEFARRFERASWRERHDLERRRLKQRFEQRRQQYNRQLKEQEDEVRRVEQELAVSKQRLQEAENKRKQEAVEKKSTILSNNFDYTSYGSSIGIHHEDGGTISSSTADDSQRDSVASDSSGCILSPVPGPGLWETEVTKIDFVKGPQGLGFSILDYADPVNKGDKVILVYSLVEGGVAEVSRKLQVGDKLVSVGGVSVINHSLHYAVQQLMNVKEGETVQIGVNHPSPDSADMESASSNFSPGGTVQRLMRGAWTGDNSDEDDEGDEEEEEDDDDDDDDEEGGNKGRRSTLTPGTSLGAVGESSEEDISDLPARHGNWKGPEEQHGNRFLGKKPTKAFNKAPPSYSEVEALQQHQQQHQVGGGSSRAAGTNVSSRSPDVTMALRSLTPNSKQLAAMSGYTSPNSQTQFIRTRSDEPSSANWLTCAPGDSPHNLRMVESTSEETLVGSTSFQDLQLAGSIATSASGSISSPQQSSPHLRSRHSYPGERHPQAAVLQGQANPMQQHRHLPVSTTSSASATFPARKAAGEVRQVKASSALQVHPQNSYAYGEGLSPDASEAGDHSAEADSEPREVMIHKGSGPLGLALSEDKGMIVVKKVDSKSALGMDGRIRVGDQLLAINRKTVEGMSLSKVKGQLKRASKSSQVIITYLPAPQFSFSYHSSSMHSSAVVGGETSYSPNRGHPQSLPLKHVPGLPPPSSVPILTHNPPSTAPPPMDHGHMPGMMPSQQQQHTTTYQWVQSQQLQYNPPGPPAHINPQTLQAPYLEHPRPMKIPAAPPPYLSSSLYQSGLMSNRLMGQPYQPQPLAWGMQDYPQQGPSGQLSHWMNLPEAPGSQYGSYSQYQSLPMGPHQPPSLGSSHMQPKGQGGYLSLSGQQQDMEAHPPPPLPPPGANWRGPPPAYHHSNMVENYGSPSFHQVPSSGQRYGEPGTAYDMSSLHGMPAKQTSLDSDMQELSSQAGNSVWSQDSSGAPTVVEGLSGSFSAGMVGPGQMELRGCTRLVEVKRDSSGSLGISLGPVEGGAAGVVINDLSPACLAVCRGKLNPGDRILEVNGYDLRNATQGEAVKIINSAGNPVRILAQCYSGPRVTGKKTIQSSPLHSNENSWAIEDEEDEQLRQQFPNAAGHLFEVSLNRGQGGLGLSIWKTDRSLSRGVVIMQVSPGGEADRSGRIKLGDEILQVNNSRVLGWSHQQVSHLLSQSTSVVRLILLRPLPVPTTVSQLLQQQQQAPQSQSLSRQSQNQLDQFPDTPAHATNENGSSNELEFSELPELRVISLEKQEDERGFGFGFLETEAAGETRLVVTEITPGGPAARDGKLHIGDHIISLDRHTVFRMKQERALHLLQQAIARGSVTLVVMSQAQVGQEPKPVQQQQHRKKASPSKRDMNEKRMRIRSEGVQIRKVTKASSRRRPVSVDCEVQYNVLEGDNAPGQAQEMEIDQEREAVPPTKNAKPMTVSELRRGLDFYSSDLPQKEVVAGLPCEIEIFTGNQPLGITVMGVAGSLQGEMMVHKVLTGSPAATDGRLQPGDRIMRVGEVLTEHKTADQVMNLLQDFPMQVRLTVFRPAPETTNGGGPASVEIERVDLYKPEQGGLGLLILEDPNNGGVIVKQVIAGEVADRSGRIKAGDKLLSINMEDISQANQDTVRNLLQQCKGKVSLVVCHSGSAHQSMDQSSGDESNHLSQYSSQQQQQQALDYIPSSTRGAAVPSTMPASIYHSSSPTHPTSVPRPHSPPPYLDPSDSGSRQSGHDQLRGGTAPSLQAESSFEEAEGYGGLQLLSNNPLQYRRDVVGQSLPDSGLHPSLTTAGNFPEQQKPERRSVRMVHLHKGSSGFGFSIVGGKGSPKGNLPIIIKSVSPNSMAAKEGRLKAKDIILSVNDISFENVSHDFAVNTLKKLRGDIALRICCS